MFKFVSSFLDRNNTVRSNQVEIFIVRLAAGLFIAAFDGWPKFLQGIAYILQNATWPLRNSLAISLCVPPVLIFWLRSCCCLWESATGQRQPDGDAVYVA
jgi:hypothetical protein